MSFNKQILTILRTPQLLHLIHILDSKLFYRINRGYFVNINSIKDIISYTNSRLELKLNNYKEEEVIVARVIG